LVSARGVGKGREITLEGGSATASSEVDSKSRGSVRVVTDLIENIKLSLLLPTILLRRIFISISDLFIVPVVCREPR
jgi:hypothetical protein